MRYEQVVIAVLLAFANPAGIHGQSGGDAYVSTQLPLPVLRHCALRTRWIGFWPRMPEGVMLTCNCAETLVLQPNNLLGHVRITTGDEALAYVRFFTSPDTYRFFQMQGMVELVEGDPDDADAPFNVVEPKVFRRRLRRAQVRQTDVRECRAGVELACGKEFEIKRTVVLLDQRVYEVTEYVYESGFYVFLSKRLLLKDASKIGVIHVGDV